MRPLPPALIDAAAGDALPADCRGLLVRAGDSRIGGNFLLVQMDAGLEMLRPALAGGSAGIILAGWRTGADIQRLAALLSVAEAESGLADGATPILALADGILPPPASPHGLAGKSARLAALIWDHHLLLRKLGARRTVTENGEWTAAFAAARAATLLAAAAAGLPAYDSLSEHVGAAFATECERSRDDGFSGRLARDPDEAAIISALYAPAAGSTRP